MRELNIRNKYFFNVENIDDDALNKKRANDKMKILLSKAKIAFKTIYLNNILYFLIDDEFLEDVSLLLVDNNKTIFYYADHYLNLYLIDLREMAVVLLE